MAHTGDANALQLLLDNITLPLQNSQTREDLGPILLKVTVIDDAPKLETTSNGVLISDGTDKAVATGVINFGADGYNADADVSLTVTSRALNSSAPLSLTTSGPQDVVIDGQTFGILRLNPDDGSFTFTATSKTQDWLTFDLKVPDMDGDFLSPITVEVRPGDTPVQLEPLVLEFDEAKLPNGTDPITSPSVVMKNPTGYAVDTSTGWETTDNNVFTQLTSMEDLLTEYNLAKDEFTFTQLKGVYHPGDGVDVVTYYGPLLLFTTPDGKQASMSTHVTYIDDVPKLHIGEPGAVQAGQEVIHDFSLAYGGDGPASADSATISVTFPGGGTATLPVTLGESIAIENNGNVYGTITFSNTSYSFKAADAAASGTLAFRFDAKDGDGDVTTANFNLIVAAPLPPITDFDYSGTSVYNPGYDDVSLFGSFQSSITSNREGWTSSNAWWLSTQSANLLPFPSNSTLKEMDTSGAIRLQSATMTARIVDRHIGEANSIVQILDDVGIETSSRYVSDTFASRLALTSKDFSSSGGEISFNWSFSGRAWNGESDAAFWILLDANNVIVDSGAIAHLQDIQNAVQHENGITTIHVPYTETANGYRLVVGSVDGGSVNCASACLYVDTMVIQEGRYLLSGNIYKDPLLSGESVPSLDKPVIQSISLENGESISFANSPNVVTVQLKEGILTIDRNSGDYKFTTHDGKPAPLSTKIDYQITDASGRSGEFHQDLRIDAPKAYDNVAIQDSGFERLELLGSFENANTFQALDCNGWSRYGNVYTGRALVHADTLPVPTPDLLDEFTSGSNACVRLRAAGNLSTSARQAVFGTRDATAIKEILNDIGVEGDNFGYRSQSSCIDATLIQKAFSASGGVIAFGWSFYTGNQENDAAFWILKDSAGKIIDSGVLCQGIGKDSGMVEIELPSSASAQGYTLALGLVNVGVTYGVDPLLYVSDIVLADTEYHFKGNVLTDASPDGLVDFVYDDTRLASFTYNNETRHFTEDTPQLVFKTPDGELTINWNGDYYFKANDPGNVAQKFQYTIQDAEAGNSATLLVQTMPPLVHSQIPEVNAQGQIEVLGVFDQALSQTGWAPNLGSALSNVRLPASFETPPSNEYLDAHSDSQYLRVTNACTMPAQQWATLLGDSQGHLALGSMLADMGAEGNVWRSYAPKGSFVSTSFESSGGTVVFDWSFGGRAQANLDCDASFWILKDSSGKVVDSGLISQLLTNSSRAVYQYESGVCEISVPTSTSDETYTLTLGTIQMGIREYSYSQMYVGTVVHVQQDVLFTGNLLKDASLHDQQNMITAETVLSSIEYLGKVHTFDQSGALSIKTDGGGVLSVLADGSYSFNHPDGDAASVFENFTYTVRDGSGNSDWAMLHLCTNDNKTIDDQQQGQPDAHILAQSSGTEGIRTIGSEIADVVVGSDKADDIWANGGNDVIYGGAGNDRIDAGVGETIVFAGAGDDYVFGYYGNDLIYGGTGNNTLRGFEGADTFAWKHPTDLSGKDSILDFSVAQGDKLGFKDLLAANESLDSYFDKHVSDLSLKLNAGAEGNDLLSFSIQSGLTHKDVVVELSPTDSGYGSFRDTYMNTNDESQAQDLLAQFMLQNMCS